MFDFFKLALDKLANRTGFKQLENMMMKDTWEQDVKELINFMIDECKKPPFNVVAPVVKQRVIWNAIVEDKEFTGLNAKFVNRALHAWWRLNGDRVMEKLNGNTETKLVELTPEQSKAVDEKINAFIAELRSGGGMQSVPKIDSQEAKKSGAEWRSNLEQTFSKNFNNGITAAEYETKKALQRAASEFYKGKMGGFDLKKFEVDGVEVIAESESDALAIYKTVFGEKEV